MAYLYAELIGYESKPFEVAKSASPNFGRNLPKRRRFYPLFNPIRQVLLADGVYGILGLKVLEVRWLFGLLGGCWVDVCCSVLLGELAGFDFLPSVLCIGSRIFRTKQQ